MRKKMTSLLWTNIVFGILYILVYRIKIPVFSSESVALLMEIILQSLSIVIVVYSIALLLDIKKSKRNKH